MTVRHYVDNAPTTTLSSGIDSSVTSFAVASLVGYPASFPYTITVDLGTSSAEQMLVTNATGMTLTVTRNHNGQGAFSHTTNANVNHTADAIDFAEANAHINATTNVHGITGTFADTSSAQTLSNKILAGGTATFSAVAGTPGVVITSDADTTVGWEVKNHTGAVAGKMLGDGSLVANGVTSPTLTTTGNAAVGGGLTVTGGATAATFSAPTVTGTTTVAGAALAMTGNGTIAGTLGVGGNTTVTGTLGVTGVVNTTTHANVGGNLVTTGTATSAALTATTGHFTGNITADQAVTVTGNETVGGTLGVGGALTVQGTAVGMGILTAPTVTSTNGTTTSGSTETFDAILGNYVFTGLANHRYEARLMGRGLSTTAADDRFSLRLRYTTDGSTPVAASNLIGDQAVVNHTTGGNGTTSVNYSRTFVPGAHTVTVAGSWTRVNGSGTATPIGTCEMYVVDIGQV